MSRIKPTIIDLWNWKFRIFDMAQESTCWIFWKIEIDLEPTDGHKKNTKTQTQQFLKKPGPAQHCYEFANLFEQVVVHAKPEVAFLTHLLAFFTHHPFRIHVNWSYTSLGNFDRMGCCNSPQLTSKFPSGSLLHFISAPTLVLDQLWSYSQAPSTTCE
jgi:hypothetical protein